MKTPRKSVLLYGLVVLLVVALTGAASAAPAGSKSYDPQPVSVFKDVEASDNNLIYINYLAKREIISGFPDGGFHPQEGLSRAQAATLLVKAAGLDNSKKSVVFNDVSGGHWAAGSIAAAAAAGYLKGYPDGSYRPEEKLTRAQGISLVLRLSKQKDTGVELPALKDLNSQHWAARSAAVGMAAGMVGLNSDKTQFLPDAVFSRGDLSRALAVLLTTDPDLSLVPLNGSMEIKKGEVKVNDKAASGIVAVKAGDLIISGTGGEAQLSYPDGSGFLIKEKTQITVKETKGRAYIKKDGSPGTAVDWLLVDLKKGDVFGALATNPNVKEEKKTASLGEKLLAGMSGTLEYLAAGDKELPWYQSAQTQKVKVKIDMPYGVAAVRGSFWNNIVTSAGCSTSLLEGNAEISAGGKTEPLPPGKSSAVTQSNPVPTAPTRMTAAQVSGWVQQTNWLQNVVQTIQTNQEAVKTEAVITAVTQAAVPGQPAPQAPLTPLVQPVPAPVAPTPAPLVPDILTQVNEVLTQIQKDAGFTEIKTLSASTADGTTQTTTVATTQNNNTSSGTGGPSSSEESSTRLASWSGQSVTSLPNGSQTLVLTKQIGVIAPSSLPSATFYQIMGRTVAGDYCYLTDIISLSNTTLQLASLFDNPSNIIVRFFDGNKKLIGNYRIDSNGVLTNLATKTITGTISLPSGDVAPTGGIGLVLQVSGNYIGGWGDFIQNLTIPAGAGSVAYSIAVPDNLDSSNLYDVRFHIAGDYQGSYVKAGGYASQISVIDGSKSGINMSVVNGKMVSGKLTLPSPNTTDHEIPIGFWINKVGEDQLYKIIPDTGIPVGSNEASFSWAMEPGSSYNIRYGIKDVKFCADNHYIMFGFYNSSGTVVYKNAAEAISVSNSDISGIDIPVMTGHRVSGTMYLPNGETAPTGGITFNVFTDAGGLGSNNYNDWTIAEGQNSAYYALVLPPGAYNLNFWVKSPLYGGVNYRGGITVTNNDWDLIDYQLVKNPQADPWASDLWGDNSLPAIAPSVIANNSLLIAVAAIAMDSPDYTKDRLLKMVDPVTTMFYKAGDGQWYNLRTGSPVSETSISPIYFYLSGQIYLNAGNQESVYPVNCYFPRQFTITPKGATVNITSNNPELFNLDIQDSYEGRYWGRVRTGNTTGTTILNISAAKTGYTNLVNTTDITVVPHLSLCTNNLESNYSTTAMSVGDSVYMQNLWNSGDPVSLQLVNLMAGTDMDNSAAYLTNPVVNNDNITFTLASGLKPSVYGIKVIKNSIVQGMAILSVSPAGNRMFCERASYDSSTGKLIIKLGWSESASFDISKFTFKNGSGTPYSLSLGYSFEPNYGEDPSGPGKYTINDGLVILLAAADKAAINSLINANSSNLSIDASSDALNCWSIDLANNYANADNGTPLTLVTSP